MQLSFTKYILLLLFISGIAAAQSKITPPTPIEFLLGNNRIQGQTILVKNFPNSKFGIFSLSTVAADYKNIDKSNNELFSNFQINYDIYKGLKITSGVTFNAVKGFAPIGGLEYVYNDKNITIVVNPTINLNKDLSLANYAHIEYAPKNDKLNAYGRLQGLYIQGLAEKVHERSALVVRLGISYKGFATGFGMNQDYYGPLKVLKPNYGLFLHYKFV